MTRMTSSILACASSRPCTVCFRPGANEQKLRAATNDDESMADELLQHLFERERAGFAIHEREQDNRERILQRRELEESD